MRTRALVAVMVLGATTTGCAAVFKGSKAEVHFTAVPEASDVRVDGQYAGETPTTANVSRNGSQNVIVSKAGFKDQYISIKRSPDTPWWFWDIGTCVIPVMLCIPLLADAISGAWMSVDEEVRVKLDPLPAPSLAPVTSSRPPAPARSETTL